MTHADKAGCSRKATAILIGGAEQKTGERTILREVAARAGTSPLVVCTVGSTIPGQMFGVYKRAFAGLGVTDVVHVPVDKREAADDVGAAEAVGLAKVFFFTGGDQLRITSMLGGSRLWDAVQRMYQRGGTVAGTSAGASALGHTMPISAEADEHRVSAASSLLPALGLLKDLIVDQHFAQRGRMGRLIAGVSENPRLLGIGIDENTAAVWTAGVFRVIGSGAVYVVDGREVSRSNVAGAELQCAMSTFDLRLHVLSSQDCFDVAKRRPFSKSG